MGMKRIAVACLVLFFAGATPCMAAEHLRMSTTTSTENSGLLDVLVPAFEKTHDCKVDVIAVGTGKALALGRNGDVDVVFVHARPAEDEFVAEGYGVNRRDVMHNDFVVLGPAGDPADLIKATGLADAFHKLAQGKAPFVSRGDDSGTHKKEKRLWKAAGVAPDGAWYLEAGQGMGAVLRIADEKQAYTLADRGTYLAYKNKIGLEVVFEGDPALFNPYGIIAVNPAKYSDVKYDLAMGFIAFVTGVEGQQLIGEYRRGGEVLFHPDAIR